MGPSDYELVAVHHTWQAWHSTMRFCAHVSAPAYQLGPAGTNRDRQKRLEEWVVVHSSHISGQLKNYGNEVILRCKVSAMLDLYS
jgi:hypothetical protein